MLKKKIILGLSSFQFMAMARRGLFYTFLSIYLKVSLGLSVTATTLLASLTMLANSLSQTLVWGKISDKYQARTSLVAVGETIAAIGYILIYFLHVYLLNTHGSIAAAYSIIGGLTIIEFFWSMSNLGWSALISDVSTPRERGNLMSIVSSIGGVGRIIGILVSGLLYDWGGEAGGFKNGPLFFFASAIMLASVVAIWYSMRSSKSALKIKRVNDAVPQQNSAGSTNRNSTRFYWFLTSIFITSLGAYSILQIYILYVQLDVPIGATSLDITLIRNSANVTLIVASLLAGSFSDKVGRKWALGLGLGLAAVTPILYIFAQDVLQMIIINSLRGISMALVSVVGYLMASDLIPAERRGRLFGQYNAVTTVSFGIAGTLIGGPVADALIGMGTAEAAAYVVTFQVASAISLIGVVIFALKLRSKVKPRLTRAQGP